MSIFAFFLFTVVFVFAVHASEWSDTVSTAQIAVQAQINATIFKIQEQQNTTRQQNHGIAKNILNTTADFSLQTSAEVYLVTQKISSETSKLADKAKGSDISDCFQYPDHLNLTARPVLLNMSACYAEKLRFGVDQIICINRLFEDVFDRLNAIRQEAQDCGDNIHDDKSAETAVLCIEAVGIKESSIFPKFVEELTIKDIKFKIFVKGFEPLLADCRTTNGLATFNQESSTVVEKTNTCIQQKIS